MRSGCSSPREMRLLLLLALATLGTIPATLGCDSACDRYQYCDESNNSCRNCSALCAKDEYSCFHKCQNYLFKSLRERTTALESVVGIYNTVACIVLALACVTIVLLSYRYRGAIREFCRLPQLNKKEQGPVGYTHENPNTKSPKAVPKNGANAAKPPASTTVSIYPETEADNSVQTGTTSISHRYPAEDSTESYSYDNAACNVTPTSQNPMPKY
ncbi:uncharacterized protein LOC120900876 [Anopheles arabiensis]|uniref:Protein grindelwald n=1 Tax=Anopheles gambiae TaxID=7165 RepID=A0A1S4GY44_ANOGA|nr:uncharacterized protein LOC120900876 [Anopheles arabiensis]